MSLLKIKPFSIDTVDTFSFANANVVGNLVSGNASLGNLATANFFQGNGSLLTSLTGANVTGQVANAALAGTVYTNAQPNITSVGTLSGITATGVIDFIGTSNVSLGNVANLKITGGSAGQVLQSSGSGVVTWYTPTSGTGNANVVGSNTQIFFNDNGSTDLGASANLTFNKGTKTLTVDNITANGAGITYITGANVSGNVTSAVQAHYANIANSVAGANVSGNVASAVQSHYANIANSVAGANVSGNVTWAITSNWANTANSVSGTNVSGNVNWAITSNYANTANAVAGANVSGNVTSAVQSHYANIANSVAGANVSGNVTSAVQAHYANIANSVAGANVSGNVSSANVAYYESVTTQTTGTFYPVFVSGNTTGNYALASNSALSFDAATGVLTTGTIQSGGGTGGNITGANLISANYFVGNGYLLTSTNGSNVSGNVSFAIQSNYANTANAVAGANVSGNVNWAITSNYANTANAVAGANVSGNVASAVQSHYANIANSVTFTNVSGKPTTISGYGITDAYSNTNAGAYLTTYSGDLAGANLTLTGNLVISGTTTSVNSTVTRVVDPILEQGGGANGAALSNDDGKDRGTILHYYTGGAVRDAFMGWDNSNAEFGFGSAVTVASEVVTFSTYGNLRASYLLGNGSQLTGVSATSAFTTANGTSNINIATVNGNITMGVGGTANVVTVTTTGVNVAGYINTGTGNITAGNVSGGNAVSATYIIGNGSLLTSITGANVSGNVTSAVQSHYANIANSVAGANVSGNVASAVQSHYANIANSVAGANVSGNVGFAIQAHYANIANSVSGTNVTGNVGFAIQAHYANIANSVAGSNVSGEVAYAAVANSVAGSNVSGQVGNALIAGTVYTNAQPNITSVGTLTSLAVSGTTNLGAVGNVTITGGSADYFLKTNGSGVLSFASVPSTTLTVDTFTGDGSWTMKTLTVTPASSAYTIVAIGGVSQPRTSYSLSGAVITFSDPPPNGAIVEITTVIGGSAGAGGGASALDDLTDVTITSPSTNQVLKYNGSAWVNGTGGASWTYSAVSANTSAVAGYRYIVDTSSANLTITLPSSATLGDEVMIIDGTGNASTHAITVDKNGGKIAGSASNMTVTTDRAAFTLVYYNSTQGWILTNV